MFGPGENKSNVGEIGTPTNNSTTNTGPTYQDYTKVSDLLNSVDLTSPIETFKAFGNLLLGELKNQAVWLDL
jgi:hypothetical protein